MPCEEIEITLIGFVCGVLRTSNILHKFRRAVSALFHRLQIKLFLLVSFQLSEKS